eukprot:TRINITY_DN230_c0_g2_i1.p1 TRINITY_DN230_c0_g2~~TRINITY_DN230_c0_g2_i1.p1  ORF type:complete len:691 (+),score=72.80 TRINITY_DN230_c0_g2_i1:3725-5797(+)
MLKYIVEEPPADADNKRAYKFPFVVSEAFKTEIKEILDLFFVRFDPSAVEKPVEETKVEIQTEEATSLIITEEKVEAEENKEEPEQKVEEVKKEQNSKIKSIADSVIVHPEEKNEPTKLALLERLLSLLQAESELNPVLAGYFAKTLQSLLNKKKAAILSYLFKSNEHMRNLLKHSYNQSIADLIAKVLRADEDPTKDEFATEKQKLVEAILESGTDPKSPPELIKSNLKILSMLAQASHSTAFFTSEGLIEKVYKLAIDKDEVGLKTALEYLTTIIKMKLDPSSSFAMFNESPIFGQLQQRFGIISIHYFIINAIVGDASEETRHREVDCGNIVRIGAECLAAFKDKLTDLKAEKETETQSGEKAPVFGQDKMALIDWFYTMLRLKDTNLAKKIEELEFPKVLLNLVKTYYMNSTLHLRVYNIFHDVLVSALTPFLEVVIYICEQPLQFVIKCGLAERLIELYKASKSALTLKSSGRNVNKPYFVFVVRLCGDLTETSKVNASIEEYLKSARWEEFFTKEIASELERLKITDVPRKGGFIGAMKEIKEEQKSAYDLLFEKLTVYNYSDLVDQPVEDIPIVTTIETKKSFLPYPKLNRIEDEFLNDYATNNYWRTESSIHIEQLLDEYEQRTLIQLYSVNKLNVNAFKINVIERPQQLARLLPSSAPQCPLSTLSTRNLWPGLCSPGMCL